MRAERGPVKKGRMGGARTSSVSRTEEADSINGNGKPSKIFKQVKTGSDLARGDVKSISKSWNYIASIKILRSVSVLRISQEIQVSSLSF